MSPLRDDEKSFSEIGEILQIRIFDAFYDKLVDFSK